jgi:ribosomal protein S6--L-glutamate ligase
MDPSSQDKPYVALGSRLRGVPEVLTVGVKPNFYDYSAWQRALMFRSRLILYPTRHYAQFFTTVGKPIFPSLETYLYADEKIKQSTLFNMLSLPHPRTRVYYPRHHKDILKDFAFPFIAKLARASAQGRGVFKILDEAQLQTYLALTKVAYIQDYLPHERDLRVILINYQPLLAYWRRRRPEEFRTNVSQGGSIHFDRIPTKALQLAQEAARKCRLNDVGFDLIEHQDTWYLIEANMKYGRKGLRMKGMDLKAILREKLLSGELAAAPERSAEADRPFEG